MSSKTKTVGLNYLALQQLLKVLFMKKGNQLSSLLKLDEMRNSKSLILNVNGK
jgi:hypothetical protein